MKRKGSVAVRETSVAKAERFERQHLEIFIQFDITAM